MTILKNSWQNSLTQKLNQLRLDHPQEPVRLAILGIGNELRGDDAAGIAVIRTVTRHLTAALPESVLLINGENAPENQTGPLRRFSPHLVLLVDMAQMDERAGSVCWLPWQETSGLSASSHTMPPYMLANFLVTDLGCEVALIGIQPAQTELMAALSPVVASAVDSLSADMAQIVKQFYFPATDL